MTTKQFYKNVTIPVDDLIPYAKNSRTHSPEQVAQIAASIKEWGFTNPILVDNSNGVIAGHGRLLAAQKLGMAEVPCIVIDGITDTQKRAYVIADNKIAENSGWNFDLLFKELTALQELDFDVSLTAFNMSDFKVDDELFDVGEHDEDEEQAPKKTDHGYAELAIVMPVEEKKKIVALLNKIKADNDLENQYQALILLAESYD